MNGLALEAREWRRPWKLATLAIGIALLIVGAFWYEAPDWDIPISFIMAILAYLTAVDGCYWLYWRWKDPAALELMRDANFVASLALYGICGVLWLYRGSLHEAASMLANKGRQA